MARPLARSLARDAPPGASIVIPTYNEIENLPRIITEVAQTFAGIDYEILIVDDQSPDGTGTLAQQLACKNPHLRVLPSAPRKGIGAALRRGYDAARKEVILSTDADLSFPTRKLLALYRMIVPRGRIVGADTHRGRCDLVVGDRYAARAARTHSRAISALGNALFTRGLPVRDISSNFRALRRGLWKDIRARVVEDGNAMLGETVLRAWQARARIGAVPVTFVERRAGVSKMLVWREGRRWAVMLLRCALSRR